MKAIDFKWSDGRELYQSFKLHRNSLSLISELRKMEQMMILNLDFILSKLFSYIKFNDLDERTTIYLLADHGREFKKTKPLLQDRLTHIPFLISGNNKSLEIRDEFIEAPLDLYPTILSQSGIEPLEHLSGYDLFKYKAKKENYCISESFKKRWGICIKK